MRADSPLLRRHPGALLVDDSRQVEPGAIFFALPGPHADGRLHIGEAVRRGAAGVIWERGNFAWEPEWQVENESHFGLRALAGHMAAEHYGRPGDDLAIIAITGTKGKTTTAWFAVQIMEAAGFACGYIGTLGAAGPGRGALQPLAHTTPPAVVTHRLLSEFRAAGAAAVVIEASSQGLDQDRLAAVSCNIGVITNIGRDHHDYHQSAGQYLAAKQRLFLRPELSHSLVNIDDENCRRTAVGCRGDLVSIGRSRGDFVWRRTGLAAGCQGGRLEGPQGPVEFDLAMPGKFNLGNAVFAYAAALCAGAAPAAAAAALRSLEAPPGRMQMVKSAAGTAIYIDYAHTPESLSAALDAVRELNESGRVVCVFGCGGNRDPGKRQLMGNAASKADEVIVTTDNPRDEDPGEIASAAAAGVSGDCRIILDRREAIAAALGAAGAAGSVLVAGKGHETFIEGPRACRTEFSDYVAAQAAAGRVQ